MREHELGLSRLSNWTPQVFTVTQTLVIYDTRKTNKQTNNEGQDKHIDSHLQRFSSILIPVFYWLQLHYPVILHCFSPGFFLALGHIFKLTVSQKCEFILWCCCHAALFVIFVMFLIFLNCSILFLRYYLTSILMCVYDFIREN